jgi:hypothetical protein
MENKTFLIKHPLDLLPFRFEKGLLVLSEVIACDIERQGYLYLITTKNTQP